MLETVEIPARDGLRVKCKCGYEWTYGGKSNFYAAVRDAIPQSYLIRRESLERQK